MSAVHIQIREDAALGAAWRRCEAALPEGFVGPQLHRLHSGVYEAATWNYRRPKDVSIALAADSPTAALEALADALEARRAAE